MVVCQSNREEDAFQDAPSVVIEVLSSRTRRTDESEKKDAYFTIPSLRVYLLVEQNQALVVALRRTDNGFVREKYEGMQAVVPLPEIEAELPLVELYERVSFGQEPEDDEDKVGPTKLLWPVHSRQPSGCSSRSFTQPAPIVDSKGEPDA